VGGVCVVGEVEAAAAGDEVDVAWFPNLGMGPCGVAVLEAATGVCGAIPGPTKSPVWPSKALIVLFRAACAAQDT
jgi:hypothetical protein